MQVKKQEKSTGSKEKKSASRKALILLGFIEAQMRALLEIGLC